jgi:hypothetical protein
LRGVERTSDGIPVADHKILARIVERVDPADVAREMIAAFRTEIAGYRRLPDSVLSGQIFEVSRTNVELFFRSVAEGVEPTPDELAAFRESARNRASEGMPLEDLLHAYRLGGRLGWRAIAGAAEDDEERRALLAGAELLMRYVDEVSAAVAQTYLDERQHLVSEEERRLRDLADALLADGPVPAPLSDVARSIGFPVAERYRAFVQAVPGAPGYAHGQVAAALRMRGVLALTEGDRIAGLAAAEAPPETLVEAGAVGAVSDPLPRGELSRELDDLRMLVELARDGGETGLVASGDYALELLLARSPRVAGALRRRVLGPLEDYTDPRSSDLVETLATFVDLKLDRRRAAERLHVHPNTLDYRLERISKLTGLELRQPRDLALVVLALTL